MKTSVRLACVVSCLPLLSSAVFATVYVKTDAYHAGFDIGHLQGYDEGYLQGYDRGETEGIEVGEVEGFDIGWNTIYQSAYDGAYQSSLSLGRLGGWRDGFVSSFDTAVSEAREAAVTAGAGILVIGFLNGVVDGQDFISWNSNKVLSLHGGAADVQDFMPWNIELGYGDGFHDGYEEGFQAGDLAGYDEGYELGYEAAFEAAFARGVEQGEVQGMADGEAEGWDAGVTQGHSAAEDVGYQLGMSYAHHGGDLDNWSATAEELSTLALADLFPNWLQAQDAVLGTVAQLDVAPGGTEGAFPVVSVPEPSTALATFCGLITLVCLRRAT